jgi:hypothetical protein
MTAPFSIRKYRILIPFWFAGLGNNNSNLSSVSDDAWLKIWQKAKKYNIVSNGTIEDFLGLPKPEPKPQAKHAAPVAKKTSATPVPSNPFALLGGGDDDDEDDEDGDDTDDEDEASEDDDEEDTGLALSITHLDLSGLAHIREDLIVKYV